MDEYSTIVTKRPKRDWWKRKRALDLWSIPHFLFGMLTALLSVIIEMPLSTALVLTIVLAILWEWYEKLIGIKETVWNIVSDFILPIAAFTATALVLRTYPPHPEDLLVVTSAVLFLYVFTNLSGWLAYRRRNRDFMH